MLAATVGVAAGVGRAADVVHVAAVRVVLMSEVRWGEPRRVPHEALRIGVERRMNVLLEGVGDRVARLVEEAEGRYSLPFVRGRHTGAARQSDHGEQDHPQGEAQYDFLHDNIPSR